LWPTKSADEKPLSSDILVLMELDGRLMNYLEEEMIIKIHLGKIEWPRLKKILDSGSRSALT
jgi:hypothetical protein